MECPKCKLTNTLYAVFDGSQTYVCCDCGFDALYGDGDQRGAFAKEANPQTTPSQPDGVT